LIFQIVASLRFFAIWTELLIVIPVVKMGGKTRYSETKRAIWQ